MMNIKVILGVIPILFFNLVLSSCSADDVDSSTGEGEQGDDDLDNLELNVHIPPGGNTWVVNDIEANSEVISDEGIHNWSNLDHELKTFFKLNTSGSLHVGLEVKIPDGASSIRVSLGDESKEISISNSEYEVVPVGVFDSSSSGYHSIKIKGIEKEADVIADVKSVVIGGSATSSGVTMVGDDFYWGRRGPSVHLTYDMPENTDVQWVYNEINVPEGEDKIGSYFMSNGFGEGYFGMQVNSESERRILFSVWSPYETQNPEEIPEDYRIILLGKGSDVYVGEFGNEGSGGQSYLQYDWEAGNTYRFLLKGEPSENNSTDYTAYFYAPEVGDWQLIASFRRPYTSTYLTNFHSFLENFSTQHGFEGRQAHYKNQWVRDTDANWIESTNAIFTADATARSGNRMDYAGGSEDGNFYLKNGGFFSNHTPIDSEFERAPTGVAPDIDFSSLEVPEVTPEEEYFDKTEWEVIDYSSEATQGEGENGLASLILDGKPETYWHSCWTGCDTEQDYPHDLTVDLNASYTVNGFALQQRNGSRKIKDFEMLYSTNGEQWNSLGDFTLSDSSAPQNFQLPSTVTMSFLKIVAKSSHDGESFAALAEVDLF